jgi:biotin operon repressor
VVAELLRLWDAGRFADEIARALEIGETTVDKYVSRHRTRTAPRRRPHWSRVEEARPGLAERIPEYERGAVSLATLAAELGIGRLTVRRLLRENGVQIRWPGDHPDTNTREGYQRS